MEENNAQDFFKKLETFKEEEQDKNDLPLVELDSRVEFKSKIEDLEMENGRGFDFEDVEGHLVVDVYQTLSSIVVESTVAGVGPEDMDIVITPESVSIKGRRVKKEKVKKEDYLYQECFWGKFSRSIILPEEIDPEKSHASLKDGILKIVLPKVEKSKSRKVKIKLD